MSEPSRLRSGPLVALLTAEAMSSLGSQMTFLALPWFVLRTSTRPCTRGKGGERSAADERLRANSAILPLGKRVLPLTLTQLSPSNEASVAPPYLRIGLQADAVASGGHREEAPAVRAQRHGGEGVGLDRERRADRLLGLHVPELHRPVCARRCECAAVVGELHVGDSLCMSPRASRGRRGPPRRAGRGRWRRRGPRRRARRSPARPRSTEMFHTCRHISSIE
jgi:hypothetical protein